MDDCPICFGPNLQSRPNPLLLSSNWTASGGGILIEAVWDTTMDETFAPANASWSVLIDSVLRPVASSVWTTPTRLNIQTDAGAGPSVDVTLQLLVQDPALHSDHLIPVLPFGPTTVPSA